MIKILHIFWVLLLLNNSNIAQGSFNFAIHVIDDKSEFNIYEAKVMLKGNGIANSTPTDKNGIASFSNVKKGHYEVFVQKRKEYFLKSDKFYIENDETITIRLHPRPVQNFEGVAFTGKVRDAKENNLELVNVELIIGTFKASNFTDSKGNYSFYVRDTSIKQDDATLIFEKSGFIKKIENVVLTRTRDFYNKNVALKEDVINITCTINPLPVKEKLLFRTNHKNYVLDSIAGKVHLTFLKSTDENKKITFNFERDCYQPINFSKLVRVLKEESECTITFELKHSDNDTIPDCRDRCPKDTWITKTGCPPKINKFIPGLYAKKLGGENSRKGKKLLNANKWALGFFVAGGITYLVSGSKLNNAQTQEIRNRNLLVKKISYGTTVGAVSAYLLMYIVDGAWKDKYPDDTLVFLSPIDGCISFGLVKRF